VLTLSPNGKDIEQIWPEQQTLSEGIPARARKALSEALKTMDISPSSSIFSCDRAVNFMLDAKGIPLNRDQSLHEKIEEAAAKQIVIPDMKTWANQIRLAANRERHPVFDDATPDEAHQCVEFALALAQNLFVLPARIKRGLDKVRVKSNAVSTSSASTAFATVGDVLAN